MGIDFQWFGNPAAIGISQVDDDNDIAGGGPLPI